MLVQSYNSSINSHSYCNKSDSNTDIEVSQGRHPGAAGTASAVPLFRVVRRHRTTFSIFFQISGALSHNAKMKWTETAKTMQINVWCNGYGCYDHLMKG